jgi:hypothetical protein
MELVKVKDHQELRKDPRTGAILLTDKNKAEEYLSKRKVFENDAAITKEINTLKDDMKDIKSLLQQLLNGNK